MSGSRLTSRILAVAAVALLLTGCGPAPILANPAAALPSSRPEATPAPHPADPQPVALPRDDAPHQRLTEWWYYTGHLVDSAGGHWGFEDVVFRAERGGFPVTWASHLALTDESGRRFHYAQRAEIGRQVAGTTPAADGFGFVLTGVDPTDRATAGRPTWTMTGGAGHDRLSADVAPDEVGGDALAGGFGLTLDLNARKPPALHDDDGWVDFGPAGGSYYYSRTDMAARGELRVGGRRLTVQGTAWFDHQWGDFIAVGGGGWDWFAVNLADRTEVTISLVRAADGSYPLIYGTLVDPDGTAHHLGRDDLAVKATGTWTSPATGAAYPAGWHVTVPGHGLTIDLAPTVAQQELDTRATTGVTYWEGSQRVSAVRNGTRLGGEGYVELTGYGPSR
jgi:predicted secreted hydrolase